MLLLLGLLLLFVGVGSLIGFAYSMSSQLPMSVFDQSIGAHPQWFLYLFGMGAGAITLLGLQSLLGGAGLRARKGARRHKDKKATKAQTQSLQSQRDDLQAELARERADKTATGSEHADRGDTSSAGAVESRRDRR